MLNNWNLQKVGTLAVVNPWAFFFGLCQVRAEEGGAAEFYKIFAARIGSNLSNKAMFSGKRILVQKKKKIIHHKVGR